MIALLLATALALTPADVPNPRPGGWVSDVAGVIDASDEADLNRRIDAIQRETGVEIAVVTVPSVDHGTPKQFATELFERWGVGSAERDDGLLVVLAVEQRRLEMETGYGLEGPLPDGWLGVMQTQRMVPHFKRGEYGEGMDAGLEAVESRLRGEPLPAHRSARSASAAPAVLGLSILLVFGGAGSFVLLVVLVVWLGWRQRRTCPEHREPMYALAEDVEDEWLTEGQQREESVGSVHWDVYVCPVEGCEHLRTFGRRTLFSGYSRCPSCGHRTRSTRRVTEVHATRYRSGLARVTEDCAHCSYHDSYTRTIPRLPDPSTTSSTSWSSGSSRGFGGSGGFGGGRSGGGFGGGRSGGGGAGSSW